MSQAYQNVSNASAELVERVGSNTVRVDARRRHAASGIVWSADGVIVTAHHVVQNDEQIHVGLADGSTVAATLVGRDAATDLAVLRVEASDLTAASWVDAGELRVGHFVLALGRPGRTVQATLGIVSALGGEWRTHSGGHIDHYLQTDVVMYPGFSGGPLVSADGRVAGLNTSALARGVSLSVPAATVQRVVQTLLEHGHMPRGYLGVSVQPVRLPDGLRAELGQETGVMVMSAEADGPAAQAGIVQGDILVTLDGQTIRQLDDLQSVLAGDRVGRQVEARLVRGGQVQALTVTVGRHG